MRPIRQTFLLALLGCSAIVAEDVRTMVIAARRSGIIELIDPGTLETTKQIRVAVAPGSVGLNGAFASADGSTLYVKGPIASDPNGCCSLYSVDLTTVETKLASAVRGSPSRAKEGVAILRFGYVPGCPEDVLTATVAAGDRLFIYEMFGWKIDRRNYCREPIPGGAWIVDPATGRLIRQVAPDLHFSELLPDPAGSGLIGVATESPDWKHSVRLVRIDAEGQLLESRALDADFWRIVIAPVRATSGQR